jgi:hypothetical protein
LLEIPDHRIQDATSQDLRNVTMCPVVVGKVFFILDIIVKIFKNNKRGYDDPVQQMFFLF